MIDGPGQEEAIGDRPRLVRRARDLSANATEWVFRARLRL